MQSEVSILLVEDNPADVQLIEQVLLLGDVPKRIKVVKDGELALAFLDDAAQYHAESLPGLIILDLNLPKIDGHQVLEHIKANPALQHIPVVVLSTSNSDRDVTAAYEHHANCYLTKPTDLGQYFDMVRRIEEYWLEFVLLPASL